MIGRLTGPGRYWCTAVLVAVAVAAGCSTDGDRATHDTAVSSPVVTDGGATVGESSDAPLVRRTLDNGLRVTLLDVDDTDLATVMVLFDVGSHHDPPAMSGLAHAVEHVYVTGAAGTTAERTVEELMADHPDGWNAQTGTDHTVIATVFPAADLPDQLAEAADRLAGVSVTEPLVERERARLVAEVTNMMGGISSLGAANLARENASPTPHGGSRGGDLEFLSGVTAETLRERIEQLYHPGNARLIVVGPMPDDVDELIDAHFGPIEGGELAPEPTPAAPPTHGTDVVTSAVGQPSMVAVAWPAPPPDHADHPAFLVLVARLFTASAGGGPTVVHPVLDDPSTIVATRGLEPGAAPDAAVDDLAETVRSMATAPLGDDEPAAATVGLGGLLGIDGSDPATIARTQPYTAAYRLGRLDQLDVDPLALGAAVESVTPTDFAGMVERLFGPDPGGGVVLGG